MSERDSFSSALTDGVRVSVQSQCVEAHSVPAMQRYVFSYRVRIENLSHPTPVQLRSRHWIIVNQLGEKEEVRGAGVVGLEPTIAPGESFEYQSGAVLTTPFGEMSGSYQFERPDGSVFDAEIAPFCLSRPYSLN